MHEAISNDDTNMESILPTASSYAKALEEEKQQLRNKAVLYGIFNEKFEELNNDIFNITSELEGLTRQMSDVKSIVNVLLAPTPNNVQTNLEKEYELFKNMRILLEKNLQHVQDSYECICQKILKN
jgi:predicted  nucleic acid-binding Zn-ribbon protein